MLLFARLVSRYRFSIIILLSLVTVAASPFLNPSLATGLFDLAARDLFYTTALAILVAWSCVITMRLVQLYGPLRLDGAATASVKPLTWPRLLLALVPAGLIIAQVIYISTTESALPVSTALASATAGIGLALIVVYGALLLYALLVPPGIALTFPDVVIPSSSILPWVNHLASRAIPGPFRNCSASLGRRLARFPGYSDPDCRLHPGHLLAITFTITILLLSAFFGWAILWRAHPNYPSALFCTLFLLLFLVWLFNGISFFLDYWRVPILSCFFIGSLFLWVIPVPPKWRPHGYHFATAELGAQEPLLPEDVVRGAPRVIVVAAEGGGIQAAAWTAEILTRLSKIDGFDNSIKAISSVSGGSVGAMHYLTRNNPDSPPASLRARASLLNAVGWALIFRDSRRLRYPGLHHLLCLFEDTLFPHSNMPDRAIALERQLARFLTPEDTFPQWRERARTGKMPAIFFNTTLVSTGEPVPFSNIDLPANLAVKTFQNRFKHDAGITSAVRLSASFPLVSPSASPSASSMGNLEFVDGGYYDNSGVNSALAFISGALPELDRSKARVLLIRIKSFPPEPAGIAGYRPGLWQSPEWLKQFAAPLGAMLSTRTSGQDNSTARALELTALAYINAIDFTWIDARFPALPDVKPEKVPLNWHLTKTQQRWIDDAWAKAGPGIEMQVRSFLTQ